MLGGGFIENFIGRAYNNMEYLSYRYLGTRGNVLYDKGYRVKHIVITHYNLRGYLEIEKC